MSKFLLKIGFGMNVLFLPGCGALFVRMGVGGGRMKRVGVAGKDGEQQATTCACPCLR